MNPAVSFAFAFVWGKLPVPEAFVRVAGQMAGGALAFPLLQAASTPYGVTIGGPGFAGKVAMDAAFNEGVGVFWLLAVRRFNINIR